MNYSKLKQRIKNNFALKELDLHITLYGNLQRFYVTYKKKVILDYPRDWELKCSKGYVEDTRLRKNIYNMLEFYLENSFDYNLSLLNGEDDNFWQLLLTNDKRLGRRRVAGLKEKITFEPAKTILIARFGGNCFET